MIRQADNASNAWRPEGLMEFEHYYPNTRWVPVSAQLNLTDAFIDLWNGEVESYSDRDPDRSIAVVLTPGLFAEWLPGCFRRVAAALRQTGYRVFRSRVRTGISVFDQAKRLAAELSDGLDEDERFIWCGHSKGGLEALRALESNAALRNRCIAAIAVQPPVGISHVLEHLNSSDASTSQKIAARVLASSAFINGVRDISIERDAETSQWLHSFTPSVPTLCAASWSLVRNCPSCAMPGQTSCKI